MARYCPLCDASSDDRAFVGELCVKCAVANFEKSVKLPDTLKVNICRSCGKIKNGEYYEPYTPKAMASAIGHAVAIKGCEAKLIELHGNFAQVELLCDIAGEQAKFEKRFGIKIGKQMCKQCSMKAGGYFEALVQLRGNNMRVTKMTEKLTKYIEKKGGFIAKMEDVPSGRDLYVSSKALVNLFMAENDRKPLRSFTLFGMRAGKKVYRNIYSLRL